MDWANERYVRLYTRDTPGWLMMSWQARATLALLLRKFDRAGLIDLAEFAGDDAAAVVAEMVKLPAEVVCVGLADLFKRQTLVINGRFLVMPNFIEAQETSQSDKMRKAEQRARARERAMANDNCRNESHEVTGCHELSQPGHAVQETVTPSLAVPSLAVLSSDAHEGPLTPEETTRIRAISKSDRPPPPAKPKAESDYDLAKRVWVELWSAKYGEAYIFQPASGPGSEDYALQRLGRAAKAASGGRTEQTLRHWVKSFLRDSGARNWLSDNKHPLRSIERDLNKYGLPKVKAVPVNSQRITSEEPVPLSVEEQKKRAESLAGLVGKIGVGR